MVESSPRCSPDTMLFGGWKMLSGWRFARSAGIVFLCIGSLQMAYATAKNHDNKKKAQPQLPTLPSGPSAPVQPIPLDSMAPAKPRVTYENGQLTIVAENSTLKDILSAVRKQTGVQIDVPDANERMVTHLGPGPARKIIAQLLDGSRFNYVLLWSPQDPSVLTRVILEARRAPVATPTTVDADAGNAADTSAADHASADSSGNPDRQQQLQVLQQQQRQQQQQLQLSQLASSGTDFPVPEIDAGTGLSAVALITCAIPIIRR